MKGTAVDKICDAMLDMLEEQPLNRISVKELTALAGVNRSSYSYHFYTKEDVLTAIFRRFNLGLGTIFYRCFSGTDDAEAISMALHKVIFEYYYDRLREVEVLEKAGFESQFRNSFCLSLEELFHQLEYTVRRPDGSLELLFEGANYDLVIKKMVYSILADLDYWADYRYKIPVDEMVSLSHQGNNLLLEKIHFKSKTKKNH